MDRLEIPNELHFWGKSAVLVSLAANALRIFSHMTVNDFLLAGTSILGIIYLGYKIAVIRIQLKEMNENRVNNGKKPITFNFKFRGRRTK